MLSSLSKELARILNQKCSELSVNSKNSKQAVTHLVSLKLFHDEKKRSDLVLVTYDVDERYPSIDISDTLLVPVQAYFEIFLTQGLFLLRILELIMINSYIQVEDLLPFFQRKAETRKQQNSFGLSSKSIFKRIRTAV